MALIDKELGAVPAKVQQQHGEQTPVHIAERIGALATAGNIAGVAAWKAIAGKYDALRAPAKVQ